MDLVFNVFMTLVAGYGLYFLLKGCWFAFRLLTTKEDWWVSAKSNDEEIKGEK